MDEAVVIVAAVVVVVVEHHAVEPAAEVVSVRVEVLAVEDVVDHLVVAGAVRTLSSFFWLIVDQH